MRLSPIDGPPLTALRTKIDDPRWLVATFIEPARLQARSVMPKFVLAPGEAKAVAGYLYAGAPADGSDVQWSGGHEVSGRELFVSRGCRGCHAATRGESGISARVPNLGGVGIKVRGDWLFRWIKDPRVYHPQTVMPRMSLSDDEIRDVVAFLLSRRDGADVVAAAPRVDPDADTSAGRALIERYGCVTCHEINGFPVPVPGVTIGASAADDPPDEILRTGRLLAAQYNCRGCHRIEDTGGGIAEHLERKTQVPPALMGEGARVQPSWLVQFFQRPTTVRPSLRIRMPDYGLSAVSARALTAYFAVLSGVSMTDEPRPIVADDVVRQGLRRFALYKCIQCHPTTIDSQLPKGIDPDDLATDLTLVKTRLRSAWIRDFMARPKAIVGMETRMPAIFYTVDGSPNVDDPEQDLDVITAYLLAMTEPPEAALARLHSERQRAEQTEPFDWINGEY